jgi:hypothetical protein
LSLLLTLSVKNNNHVIGGGGLVFFGGALFPLAQVELPLQNVGDDFVLRPNWHNSMRTRAKPQHGVHADLRDVERNRVHGNTYAMEKANNVQ